ncbi:MAG: PIN domain nuclease [Burkholderiales bacterium]|nr:PIN domain nuclease [Burkholderiales bacterium]
MIVLDTHVLAWADHDERKLGHKARAMIDRAWASEGIAVSAISFWEIGLLQVRGRYRMDLPIAEWRNGLLAGGLTEIALGGAPSPCERAASRLASIRSASVISMVVFIWVTIACVSRR